MRFPAKGLAICLQEFVSSSDAARFGRGGIGQDIIDVMIFQRCVSSAHQNDTKKTILGLDQLRMTKEKNYHKLLFLEARSNFRGKWSFTG